MPTDMPSDGVLAVPPAAPAPRPEEIFRDATMAQMLVGKSENNKKDFLQHIQNKVSQAIQSPEGKKDVERMLQCIQAYCFQGPSATLASVKSGLTAVGAIAIGLDSKVGDFLEHIMQLLLGDPGGPPGPFLAEPSSEGVSGDHRETHRVRYLACESLFNVAKVANEELLPYLDRIFDGLSRLAGDVVPDVRHAAQVLDRLLKDITSHHQDKLNVGSFVDELAKRMKFKNPMIRQLCLGWTSLVLSMENVDLESFIPRFLEGIFEVMETHDHSRDSRQNADTLLDKCLEKVKNLDRPKARRIIFQTAQRLAESCKNQDKVIRLCSLCWLYEYVKLTPNFAAGSGASSAASGPALRETDDGEAQAWQTGWAQRLPVVMDGVFDCIGDKETEVSQMAVDLNNSLLELSGSLGDGLPVTELVAKLRDRLRPPETRETREPRQLGLQLAAGGEDSGLVVVQVACLQWICLLLADSPQQMLQKETMKELFMPIFENLMHPHDQVVIASLRVMAQIMEAHPVEELTIEDFFQDRCVDTFTAPRAGPTVDLFTKIVERLLLVFSKEREMLESRGRLMIRQLCGHLDPRRLYVTVARAIQQEPNKDFAQKLVQTFNWILLTAAETRRLREELLEESQVHPQLLQLASLPGSGGTGAEVKPLFLELLEPWFHNPASALALCLWSQQYDLASELTARFASFDPTLEFLQQLDQLVMLIESPIFSRLRLRLLEPRSHPSLLKCLLGLAMLLPQAGAFQALTERMQLVQSSLLLEAREPNPPKSGDWWGQDKRTLELKALLETFDKISHA